MLVVIPNTGMQIDEHLFKMAIKNFIQTAEPALLLKTSGIERLAVYDSGEYTLLKGESKNLNGVDADRIIGAILGSLAALAEGRDDVISLTSAQVAGTARRQREARAKDIANRKVPITGISEFPLLDEIAPPIADMPTVEPRDGVSEAGVDYFVKEGLPAPEEDAACEALAPIRLSAAYEVLRDAAAAAKKPPAIFLATLGPLAEHNARADFARNLFAAGGLATKEAPVPPSSPSEAAAAFKASGCVIACICGTDARYEEEAAETAKALKAAGASHVWLAGKFEGDGIDSNIFMGCDVLHALKLAHAELGVK